VQTGRQNIGWSLVMVLSHPLPMGAAASGLLRRILEGLSGVILGDRNLVSVGFAMDALHRLASHDSRAREVRESVMDPSSCLLPYESLCRTAAS
jgi:hypothetical protein